MGRIVYIFTKYILISIPIGIALAHMLENDMNPWISIIILGIGLLLVYFLLNEIGESIKTNEVRRRYIICIRTLLCEIYIFVLLSQLFMVESDWFMILSLNIIYISVALMLFKIDRINKNATSSSVVFLRLIIFIVIMIIITTNIAFIA